MAHKTLTLRAAEQEQRFDADGDILAPLRRVREEYLTKATELDDKAYGDDRAKILGAAAAYRKAAAAIQELIEPTVEAAELGVNDGSTDWQDTPKQEVSVHDAGLGAVSA